MLELRHVKLSLYYFLKTKLDASDYGSTGYFNDELVTLMDSYPSAAEYERIKTPDNALSGETEIVLPIVALSYGSQIEFPFQLGDGPGTTRRVIVSVFGREETETEDLTQQIFEWFRDNNVSLNNYNEGFPPTVTPTQVGTIEITDVSVTPVQIYGSANVADKYKHDVSFTATTFITAGSETTFAT